MYNNYDLKVYQLNQFLVSFEKKIKGVEKVSVFFNFKINKLTIQFFLDNLAYHINLDENEIMNEHMIDNIIKKLKENDVKIK